MEPRKITGLTVHPQDGSPAIDVDTAVLALFAQLGREGDTRAQGALGALINFASQETARREAPWQVREPDGAMRIVEWVNETTRVIQLDHQDGESNYDGADDGPESG